MTDAELVGQAMRRWIELVAARDLPGLEAWIDDAFHEDAQVDLGPGGPSGSVRIFLDWARAAFAVWNAEGLQPRYEVVEVIDRSDSIAVPVRSLTVIDGQRLTTGFTYVFEVRDAKITSMSLMG